MWKMINEARWYAVFLPLMLQVFSFQTKSLQWRLKSESLNRKLDIHSLGLYIVGGRKSGTINATGNTHSILRYASIWCILQKNVGVC